MKKKLYFLSVLILLLLLSIFAYYKTKEVVIAESTDTAVNVSEFGAVGNGINDDTLAIQTAIDSISNGGVVELEPGKKYKITSTLNIDVNKVKVFEGNNSHLLLDTDIVAINLKGDLTTGTATPTDSETKLLTNQFKPIIRNVQISSNSDIKSEGTGILLSGTFGATIENNNLYNLKRGIEIADRNRNITITNNHIWNCKEYCLYYNHANVHQSIINNNHLAYAKTVVYFDNGDVHNIQIVGNDIEGGYSQNNNHDNVIRVVANDVNSQISQIQITGNSIEEHFASNHGIISFERRKYSSNELKEGEKAPYLGIWELVGNEISGSNNAINLVNGLDGVISGNSIKNIKNNFIQAKENLEAVNITGNYFGGTYNQMYGGTVLYMEAGSVGKSGSLGMFAFDNNIAAQLNKNPICIKMADGATSFEIFETSISNNKFQSTANRGANVNERLEGYMFNIEASVINNLIVSNNMLRGRDYNEHGMYINANSNNNLIITENIIRGLVPRDGTSAIKYKLPSPNNTIIISDNL